MTTQPPPETFDELEDAVADWQARNWPDPGAVDLVLAVTKVAEEAGELVGALTKWHEGRGDPYALLEELGDVVIASIGAALRLDLLFGDDALPAGTLEELALRRWKTVGARDYRQEARS